MTAMHERARSVTGSSSWSSFGPAPSRSGCRLARAAGLLAGWLLFRGRLVGRGAGVVADQVRGLLGVVAVVGLVLDHVVDELAVGVGVPDQVVEGGVAAVGGARGMEAAGDHLLVC